MYLRGRIKTINITPTIECVIELTCIEDSGESVYDDAGVIGALLLPSEGVEAGGAPSPETPRELGRP